MISSKKTAPGDDDVLTFQADHLPAPLPSLLVSCWISAVPVKYPSTSNSVQSAEISPSLSCSRNSGSVGVPLLLGMVAVVCDL